MVDSWKLEFKFFAREKFFATFSYLKCTQFCILYQSRVYDSQFSILMWTKTNLRYYEKAH